MTVYGGLDAADCYLAQTREARATAAALGHELRGFEETGRNQFHSYCRHCLASAYVSVRVLGRPPISGEAVTFRCDVGSSAAPPRGCRHCGGPVEARPRLCRAPDRMGPCER